MVSWANLQVYKQVKSVERPKYLQIRWIKLLERVKVPPPDVLKMDIEGAEILALRGMQQIVTNSLST